MKVWQTVALVVLVVGAANSHLLLTVSEYLLGGGVATDAAWIHQAFGRNFAAGSGLVLHAGDHHGASSLLWPLVLGSYYVLLPEIGLVLLATKLTGLILHLLTAPLVFLAVREKGGDRLAGLAALLVGLHPTLVAGSVAGGASALTAVWGALFLLALAQERRWATAALAFVGPFVRLDTLAILFLAALLRRRVVGGRLVLASLLGAASCAIVGSLLGGWTPAWLADTNLVSLAPSHWYSSAGPPAFNRVPLADSSLLLGCVAVLGYLAARRGPEEQGTLKALMFLGAPLWLLVAAMTSVESPEPTFAFQNSVSPALVFLGPAAAMFAGEVWARLADQPKVVRWLSGAVLGGLVVLSFALGHSMVASQLRAATQRFDNAWVPASLELAEHGTAGEMIISPAVGVVSYFNPAAGVEGQRTAEVDGVDRLLLGPAQRARPTESVRVWGQHTAEVSAWQSAQPTPFRVSLFDCVAREPFVLVWDRNTTTRLRCSDRYFKKHSGEVSPAEHQDGESENDRGVRE